MRPQSTLGACAPLRPRFVPATSPPILSEAATRLAKDYARISSPPDGFNTLHQALEAMQKKEPNYPTKELAAIKVSKIAIAEGDHEEFIVRAHTDYLAATIPGAKLIILPNVSHFAPWQDPQHLTSQSSNFSTIEV